MWAQKVLFAEWRQSPKQVLQVLGRFNSVGDKRRPQIQILSDESLFGPASTLVSRMAGINSLIRSGAAENAIEKTFTATELSAERLGQLTQAMLVDGPRGQDTEWHDQSEEADEW